MTAVGALFASGADHYVPYFQITVGGRELPATVIHDVVEVSYQDDVEQIDSFDVTINNWDADAQTLKFSDEDTFLPGQELKLEVGYRGFGELTTLVTGDITSIEVAFPAAGQPTLVVGGLNLLHRLRRAKASYVYEDKTDSDIATEVAGRLGIDIDTSGASNEQTHDYILQDNEYDIVFLMGRARRIGYDLLVREGDTPTLHFGPSASVRDDPLPLQYGSTLIDFTPMLDTAFQVGKVTVHGWDAVRRERINVTKTRADLSSQALTAAGGLGLIDAALDEREEVISDHPVANVAEAETLALETLQRVAHRLGTGSGSTIGTPQLRAGTVLELSGVGTRFSGRYFVTASTHTINDSGYTTEFDCRREEV